MAHTMTMTSSKLRMAANFMADGTPEEQRTADLLFAIADRAEEVGRSSGWGSAIVRQQKWSVVFARAVLLAGEIVERREQ